MRLWTWADKNIVERLSSIVPEGLLAHLNVFIHWKNASWLGSVALRQNGWGQPFYTLMQPAAVSSGVGFVPQPTLPLLPERRGLL